MRARRKELFEPENGKHHGRIFKLMGDGLLGEFGSVVDAVECAAGWQRGMAERNDGVGKDRRIEVRIDINFDDVIVEEAGPDLSARRLGAVAVVRQPETMGKTLISSRSSSRQPVPFPIGPNLAPQLRPTPLAPSPDES